MNERIRQLAEQAGIEFTYDPTETPMRAFVECWEDEMEKFAELIIRECTDLFADQQNMIVNPNKPFAYRTVRALAQHDRDTVRKIREHFGVEE